MPASWKITFHPKVAKDFKQNVAIEDRNFLFDTIQKRLSDEPDKAGNPLSKELAGYRRIRISKYRVIYQIKQKSIIVFILTVDRREDVYQEVLKRLGLV